ncbi:MAG: hypothetical protein IKZ42_08750 [Clostridiales bacterium]|nr:hypothetical protein [Clostridiales bacterium]
MKKLIALIMLSSLLLTACGKSVNPTVASLPETDTTTTTTTELTTQATTESSSKVIENPGKDVDLSSFKSMADPALLEYVENDVFANLEERIATDDCEIVNVKATYVSKEYIEELNYNSQKNIYFGYSLDELEDQLEGKKYVFSLTDEGTTGIKIIEDKEDHYNEIVRNVAIGTGIILICVTVAVATYGAGSGASAAGTAAAINVFFVAAAKEAVKCALIGATVSYVTSSAINYYQTGDYQEALSEGLYGASSGYMWGALFGAVSGGLGSLAKMPKWMKTPEGHPTWQESEADIAKTLGAESQVSFLGGKEVSMWEPGATRPDAVITNADNTITAVEIKNYNLADKANLNMLRNELKRQVTQRLKDLPEGSKQMIYLDVRGRGYTPTFLENVKAYLYDGLGEIYPDIPIVFFGG